VGADGRLSKNLRASGHTTGLSSCGWSFVPRTKGAQEGSLSVTKQGQKNTKTMYDGLKSGVYGGCLTG